MSQHYIGPEKTISSARCINGESLNPSRLCCEARLGRLGAQVIWGFGFRVEYGACSDEGNQNLI